MSELLRPAESFEVAVNAFFIIRCSWAYENKEKMVMTSTWCVWVSSGEGIEMLWLILSLGKVNNYLGNNISI